MASKIDTGTALHTLIIGIEANEGVLWRNGQGDFEVGQKKVVRDSAHAPMRTNKEQFRNRRMIRRAPHFRRGRAGEA